LSSRCAGMAARTTASFTSRLILLDVDAVIVLRRDDDGVHALGRAVVVLDRDLALAIGPEIADLAGLA